MTRIAGLAALACLLTACGADDANLDTADTTTSSSGATSATEADSISDELDADTPIGADGIGPLKAGMTLAEVREAAGTELILEGFEAFEGYCWFADVKGLEEEFSLLFLSPERTSPVSSPDEGELGRVSTYGDIDSSPAPSTGGPGIGSTKDEVMQTYGTGHTVEVTPHKYAEGGEYLDVRGSKSDDGLLLRFETDGAGKVTAIHGGLEDAARLVEGCA